MADPLQNARGLLKKAENDLFAARAILASGRAFDMACFHCQQAVEKSLKAVMALRDIEYPWTHNLRQLADLVMPTLPSLAPLEERIAELTPFAVDLRYDPHFDPPPDVAGRALSTAEEVYRLVEGIVQ